MPRFSGYNVDASEECLNSLIQMKDYSEARGTKIEIIPRSVGRGLHIARNHQALANAMRGDWLLTIGSDHSFNPDALELLLAAATDEEGNVRRPIISGVTAARIAPHRMIAYRRDDSGKNFVHVRPGIDFTETDCVLGTVKDVPRGACGSGFCLYHRSVFDTVPFPWFDAGVRLKDMGNYGPDVRICSDAAEFGIAVAHHYGVMYLHHEPQPIHPARYINFIQRDDSTWMAEIHALSNNGSTEDSVQGVVAMLEERNRKAKEAEAEGEEISDGN